LIAMVCAILAMVVAWPRTAIQADQQVYQTPYPWIDSSSGGMNPIQPVPLTVDLDERAVALGEKLFHDPRLSGGGAVSCSVCHVMDNAGIDGRKTSMTMVGQSDTANTPTVFNSGLNYHFLWSGCFDTLEDQIEGVMLSPLYMDAQWPEVISRLVVDLNYMEMFTDIYDDGITPANIRNAIATFERSLITPNAPFDRFLRGEVDAISADQKAGFVLFQSYGCVACHQGINIGGNLMAPLGVFQPYFGADVELSDTDMGHFSVSGQERDRHVFRVPSLRNIARTAPYFHDGSKATLRQAVVAMGKFQVGRDLPEGDISLLVNFLHALTGEYKGRPL